MSSKQVAVQRHHDYYVKLKQRGELKPEDEPQYQLAIAREKEGLVQPLSNNKENK